MILAALSCMMFYGCGDDSSGEDTVKACGNSQIEGDETCDDGNTESGDGCSADCLNVEDGYTCPKEGGACTKQDIPAAAECGNGKLEDDEACDDGNKSAGDGCSSDCRIEDGYICETAGKACSKAVQCGNGKIESGEACDDGNSKSDDGCSSKCEIEDGYTCAAEGEPCTASAECGNSKLDADETCDDGNAESDDGCSSDCQTEDGYSCEEPGYSCIPKSCGNSIVEENEVCDAGDLAVDYTKTNEELCARNCQWAHYCGDGLFEQIDRDNGEECDGNGTDTSADYNGCTLECKRSFYCGDGQITHEETCDDGNPDDGDGCSAQCKTEDGYFCETAGSPCVSLNCGNDTLDEGEQCDDGNRANGDGCSQYCVPETGYVCVDGKNCHPVVCGDGAIEGSESCEDGNTDDGDGCSSSCQIEAGWICPNGKNCHVAGCGDNIVAGDEDCDDGNSKDGDGCTKYCERESGFACPKAGGSCHATKCGDGTVEGDETCDEGTNKTEGCANCKIVMGWECLTPGAACTKTATLGNGKLEGAEECDEGEIAAPGNKTEGCQNGIIAPGWRCPTPGASCIKGDCGDGTLDKGEACDDGNIVAGDGCDPLCRKEMMFSCKSSGSCKPICGDGITMWMLPNDIREECDDGNTISGDGCSADCKKESGWTCTDFQNTVPDYIDVPANYYDFINYSHTGSGDGYMTEAFINSMIAKDPECSGRVSAGRGFPDFQRYGGSGCDGMVHDTLDSEGKPVLNSIQTQCTNADAGSRPTVAHHLSCGGSYHYWYRYEPGVNRLVQSHLRLFLFNKEKGVYRFDSSRPCSDFACGAGAMHAQTASGEDMPIGNFVPINKSGYCSAGNCDELDIGGFTTEIKTYFQYKGGEELSFQGNDDVWVFLNNKLFVDLGGMQGSRTKTGVLKSDKYKDTGKNYDPRFDVYEGGIYNVTLFNAERMMTGSSFQLSLSGFVNAGKATCSSVCGDGLVRGAEECDPIAFADPAHPTQAELDDAAKKGCSECKIKPYCGNGKREGYEECDGETWCGKDCKYSDSKCGDGKVEGHEQCDEGENNGKEGSKCLFNCLKVGCGNGIVESDEECDDGNADEEDNCLSSCKRPYCGDGFVQKWLGEVCDNGVNDGAYNSCGLGCSYLPPRCGDAVLDTTNDEECDLGTKNNTGKYGTCTEKCKLAPRCGDGHVDEEYEECDDGEQNGSQGNCTANCRTPIN